MTTVPRAGFVKGVMVWIELENFVHGVQRPSPFSRGKGIVTHSIELLEAAMCKRMCKERRKRIREGSGEVFMGRFPVQHMYLNRHRDGVVGLLGVIKRSNLPILNGPP